MSGQSIRFSIADIRIHCDQCGWVEHQQSCRTVEDLEQRVGFHCPECGAVCVTQEDADTVKLFLNLDSGTTDEDSDTGVGVLVNTRDLGNVEPFVRWVADSDDGRIRFDCDSENGAALTYETPDGKEHHRIPLTLHQLHDLQDIADAAVTILKDTE